MRDLLAHKNRAVVEKAAKGNLLVVLDFDGTLAPIVPDPSAAAMSHATRALLERLARLYPCGVITGRSRVDVLALLVGVRLCFVVGNHGLEWESGDATPEGLTSRVTSWRRAFELGMAGIQGVLIEDKGLSLSVHLRGAKANARAKRLAASLEGARVISGIRVLNVLPVEAPGKGAALVRMLKESGCERGLFVGDDVTDEDAFMAAPPGVVITVRVGCHAPTSAAYCLRSQHQTDRLLQLLIEIRELPGRDGS